MYSRSVIASISLLCLCCGGASKGPGIPLVDQVDLNRSDLRSSLEAELTADILEAYSRDLSPELASASVGTIGAARIGVGPGDVLLGDELARAPSRWPLVVDPFGRVESKRLRIEIAKDLTTAWVSDEVSWRIPTCGKHAILPLRLTALYARESERWVNVFEHLSYGSEVAATGQTVPRGKQVEPAVASRDVADAVSRAIAPMLRGSRGAAVDQAPTTLALGPAWQSEYQGKAIGVEPLTEVALIAEERRVGVVGRDAAKASVAYWVGTLLAKVGSGKVRLRGTFVLERRGDGWALVQSHISLPVDDDELAARLLGTAFVGLNPLRAQCN